MKILATGSLNLSDIPKEKLIKGAKGMYLNYKILINSAPDQFGNNGSIMVDKTAEERAAKVPDIYLGNHKVDEADAGLSERPTSKPQVESKEEDDLPF